MAEKQQPIAFFLFTRLCDTFFPYKTPFMLDYLVSLHRKEVSYQSFSPLKNPSLVVSAHTFSLVHTLESSRLSYTDCLTMTSSKRYIWPAYISRQKSPLSNNGLLLKRNSLSHNSWCCCYFDRHFVVHGRIFEPFVKRLVSAKDPAEYTHHPISARIVLL